MSIQVRRAIDEDAANLIELNRLFDDADTVSLDVDSVRTSLSENLTEKVYVAEINNQLIGFATLRVTNSFCYLRPTAELTGIFVKEENRRNGVASLLIQEIINHCQKLEVLELFLRVNRKNHGAISFYQRNGISESEHCEYRIKYYE